MGSAKRTAPRGGNLAGHRRPPPQQQQRQRPLPTMGELYHQLCTAPQVDTDWMRQAQDQAHLQRVVEPALQHLYSTLMTLETPSSSPSTITSPLWLQACRVWAHLVVYEGQSTQQKQQSTIDSNSNDTTITTTATHTWFHRISPMWKHMWHTLITWQQQQQQQSSPRDVTSWILLLQVVHGMVTLPMSLSEQTEWLWETTLGIPMLGSNDKEGLLSYVPPRRREWELQCRMLQQSKTATTTISSSPEVSMRGVDESNDTAIPFVVTWLQHVLHVFQGLGLARTDATSESSDQDMDEDNDEENDEETDHTLSKQRNASVENNGRLIHMTLVILRELLGAPVWKGRSALVQYLDAWHWMLYAHQYLGVGPHSTKQSVAIEPDTWKIARTLLQQVQERLAYPVHPQTGAWLSRMTWAHVYHARARWVQGIAQRYYPRVLADLMYSGVDLLCQDDMQGTNHKDHTNSHGSFIQQSLQGLSDAELKDFLFKLRLLEDNGTMGVQEHNRDFLVSLVHDFLQIPVDPCDALQAMPLYPTESLLWDFFQIPPQYAAQNLNILSLPQLTARYIAFPDYCLRLLTLVRLNSAFDIRADLVDAIRRLRPVLRQERLEDESYRLHTEFAGWARMALEISAPLQLIKVHQPLLGGWVPPQIIAEFGIDLQPCGDAIRREWSELGEFDNLFLVSIDASKMSGKSAPTTGSDRRLADDDDPTFPDRYGVTMVRGCMILQIRDESGETISLPDSPAAKGTKRVFRVALDPAQYNVDVQTGSVSARYKGFNLVVRRQGRENNFKAVLETIRGLMTGTGSIERSLPTWLQPIILGHGDAAAANYKSKTMQAYSKKTMGVTKPDDFLDFADTFVDEEHLRATFQDSQISVDGRESLPEATDVSRCCYRLRFKDQKSVEAVTYSFPDNCNGNPVPFTPVQVEAIRSGLSPGLTLIVGPPGTGKTDVAVQIIASLYHSFPTQRTVIVTHSNAALNDIFQKVMARGDVDERYLLRLGAGERELDIESTHDFTKIGRVQYTFAQRAKLLEEVQLLSESLGLSGKAERGADGSPSYTCETAGFFRQHHVRSRISRFEKAAERDGLVNDHDDVTAIFPFLEYSQMKDNHVTLAAARQFFQQLHNLFEELEEYRPLEILRTQRQRSDYLIMKQARVVAMTCTHAAIARSHLIAVGFQYDNIVIEEAGQMMENDTFIPFLLQGSKSTSVDTPSRLKRICILGDHNQLPPIIKNMTLARHSHLDRSLFARLIELGIPYIQLDKQGRARPEIASLYGWRYNHLGNLEHVLQDSVYQKVNAGLAHTFQAINVEDFNGMGESAPTAHFYQNVGEAEYAVALFQYLVLIGHAPQSITLLTTYNGQKALITDILNERCGPGAPLAQVRPRAVSTVDQYQGQQNDLVILSLVRTKSMGHIRDVRRWVVALSRARLGLYVVCRWELFADCYELQASTSLLAERPTKLQLVLNETFPTERTVSDELPKNQLFEVEDVTHLGAMVHQMQQDLIQSSS
jgi:intron-binding protein aquarius